MKKKIIYINIFLLLAVIIFAAPIGEENITDFPDPPEMMVEEQGIREVVLAGGCFWGMEAVFERLNGVLDVVSGYSGGQAETASYNQVGTGTTGHAESIHITYDSSVISFGTLLKVFFSIAHDPTQLNYQGPDVGTEYRSVIFYMDEGQKQVAEEYIQILDRAKVFPKKIVTELTSFEAFYPAELYHQDFIKKNPNHPYIVYWDVPKVEHLEREFPDLVKE